MRYSYLPFILLVFAIAACSHPVTERSDATVDDYAVYSAYLNAFLFYKNVPRKDTVIIHDTTSMPVSSINPDMPWSWIADRGDQCQYARDTVCCRQAHSHVWEPLLAELKQQPNRPGYKLAGRFRVNYPIKLLSEIPFDELSAREETTNTATYVFDVSPIIYNASMTKALFFGRFYCGGTCGRGELVILEKLDQRWVLIDTFRLWTA